MGVNEIRQSAQSFPSLVRHAKAGQTPKTPAEAGNQHSPSPPPEEIVTADEKRFFAGLFPQAANEIQAYQVYTPGGKRTLVQSGTLVDRKG